MTSTKIMVSQTVEKVVTTEAPLLYITPGPLYIDGSAYPIHVKPGERIAVVVIPAA